MARVDEMVREKVNRDDFVAYPAQDGDVYWLAMIALRAEFIFSPPEPDLPARWALEKAAAFRILL